MLDTLAEQVSQGQLPLERAATTIMAAVAQGTVGQSDVTRAIDHARSALQEGQLPDARMWAIFAVALTEEAEDTQARAIAFTLLGLSATGLAIVDVALESFVEAIRLFEARGERGVDLANCYYTLGYLQKDGGDLVEAAESLESALALFHEHDLVGDQANARYVLGEVRYGQRQFTEAENLLNDAISGYAQRGAIVEAARSAYLLAQVKIEEEDSAAAETLLEGAIKVFKEQSLMTFEAHGYFTLAQLQQDACNFELALSYLDHAEQLHSTLGFVIEMHRCRYSRAQIFYRLGRLAEIPVILAQAETIFRHNNQPIDGARCRYLTGLLAIDAGRREDGATLLTQAEEVFSKAGHAPEAALCREALARLSVAPRS